MEALILVGSGMAVLAGIGAYKLREHLDRKKIERLEMQNTYLMERNANLRKLNDLATRKERDARTAQYLAERDVIILESREKEWAKRLMAEMAEQDTAA